jgi:hypothetical protein
MNHNHMKTKRFLSSPDWCELQCGAILPCRRGWDQNWRASVDSARAAVEAAPPEITSRTSSK